VGVDRNGKGAVDVFVEAAGSGEGIVAVVIGIIIEFAGGVTGSVAADVDGDSNWVAARATSVGDCAPVAVVAGV
ncbi:unnamed protein product, partial [Rotaria socialis]